jgi:hypothetical protein
LAQKFLKNTIKINPSAAVILALSILAVRLLHPASTAGADLDREVDAIMHPVPTEKGV